VDVLGRGGWKREREREGGREREKTRRRRRRGRGKERESETHRDALLFSASYITLFIMPGRFYGEILR